MNQLSEAGELGILFQCICWCVNFYVGLLKLTVDCGKPLRRTRTDDASSLRLQEAESRGVLSYLSIMINL